MIRCTHLVRVTAYLYLAYPDASYDGRVPQGRMILERLRSIIGSSEPSLLNYILTPLGVGDPVAVRGGHG